MWSEIVAKAIILSTIFKFGSTASGLTTSSDINVKCNEADFTYFKYFRDRLFLITIYFGEGEFRDDYVACVSRYFVKSKTSNVLYRERANDSDVELIIKVRQRKKRISIFGLLLFMPQFNIETIITSQFVQRYNNYMHNPTAVISYDTSWIETKGAKNRIDEFCHQAITQLKVARLLLIIPYNISEPVICHCRFFEIGNKYSIKATCPRNKPFDYIMDKALNLMKNYPVRISYFNKIPSYMLFNETDFGFIRTYSQKDDIAGGIDGFLMGDVIRSLHFRPTYIRNKDGFGDGEFLPNGTATGVLREIINKESDMSFNSRFILGYEDNEKHEYLNVINYDKLCIVVPYDGDVPIYFYFLDAIQLSALFLLLGLNFTISIMRWCEGYFRNEKLGIWQSVYETYVMLIVPLPYFSKKKSRLTLTISLFITIIVITLYQGYVQSFLTSGRRYDMSSMEELDASNLNITASSTFKYIFDSDGTNAAFKSLNQKLSIDNDVDALVEIENGAKLATVIRKSDVKWITKTNLKFPKGTNNIYVIPNCSRTYILSFIVSKDFPYKMEAKTVLQLLLQGGIPDFYNSITEHLLMLRHAIPEKPKGYRPLKFNDFYGHFVLLGYGCILSLMTFAMELLINMIQSNKRIKPSVSQRMKYHSKSKPNEKNC